MKIYNFCSCFFICIRLHLMFEQFFVRFGGEWIFFNLTYSVMDFGRKVEYGKVLHISKKQDKYQSTLI